MAQIIPPLEFQRLNEDQSWLQENETSSESDTEEDDDIDDQEADEAKYSAPKFLREHIDNVVDEIKKIVVNNEPDISIGWKGFSIRRSTITCGRKSEKISEKQKQIAEEMLVKMIQRKIPHIRSEQFQYFDMFIIVPYFHSLGKSN